VLCSNCRKEIKPVVAIDVDGTLGDYHGHFLNFAADWLGIDRVQDFEWSTYNGKMSFSEYNCNIWNIDLATYRQIKLAYRQGGMKRTMPVFDGAYALCASIRDAGGELWITTTRPYLSLDNIVPDTVEWCRRHEIEYDGMLFDEDKYEQLATRVDPGRVVAIFDDLPEMVAAAEYRFPGRSWLVMGRYNSEMHSSHMCDIDSAADLAVESIHYWKRENDVAA
jgi:phosphoglycolate phosphatase-like HAD superfamily hydrolase